MEENTIATAYLKRKGDKQVVLALPGTKYQLHLHAKGDVMPSPQGRVKGMIRCPVWKLDQVSAGGAYIEPVMGRPRRVQGRVVGVLPESNSVIVEVKDCPIIGDLPPRWNAGEIAIGARVGLDVREGSTFEAAPQTAGV